MEQEQILSKNGKHYVTIDGNQAAASRAYPFTEVAAIYPITPSSPMAGATDSWSANGRKNIYGQTVTLTEMQSEAGAIGAVHGAAQAGALATSYTSSQGLMLMIPVLYRIAGERLPVVLHVAARTVGTHAMSIFGDHSDVMACRSTGFAQMCTATVQEISDLAPVAHLAAIEGRVPVMHFFDGFRTSHEINKVDFVDESEFTALINKEALGDFKNNALNPEHPYLRNTVQNDDVYFQVREANNTAYNNLPAIFEKYFDKVSEITGRQYKLFRYYGAPDAEDVVIAMGSVSGAAREAVDQLLAAGRKVGYIQVLLYRPFSLDHFLSALPETVKNIGVLDRCKDMGALGEPLYEDIRTALYGRNDVRIYGGRYGLSSKDTSPGMIMSVFDNIASKDPIDHFTIGIVDDVTHLSLEPKPYIPVDKSLIQCKFWGLGGDGTVGANHNTVKIISNTTDKYAQAYFEYDAKKSFGLTRSHLRFSDRPIESSYYVKTADFVAVHAQHYINHYDIIPEIREGGTLLLNCIWDDRELEQMLSPSVKRQIYEKKIKFYTINATKIAEQLGLGSYTNTILQAAFFSLMEIIPAEDAFREMKDAVRKTYFAKGDEVINMNIAAIDEGAKAAHEVIIPETWKDAADIPETAGIPAEDDANEPPAVKKFLYPIDHQRGYQLPVSAFKGYEDGHIDVGLTAYEKKGIAVNVPEWDPAKCIQCNRCSFVCPHAVIRPYLLNRKEAENAPEGFRMTDAKGKPELKYSIQISNLDCTGCGSCVSVCPAKEKAITMKPAEFSEENRRLWEYALSVEEKDDIFNVFTVKGSQFRTPLVEFSAACAGCGETPYAKLLTQLFGGRVYWANGTGCSQAWGAAMPGIPYTTNGKGRGPAWTNSLFENNAELELGLYLASRKNRERVRAFVQEYYAKTCSETAKAWLDGFDDYYASVALSEALILDLEKSSLDIAGKILRRKDQLTKKTFWMYGGDGWAYDIGFGGLDHVIAQGEDINVFVIDTEVYSNTGGQSSKATPKGAVAQFASAGKKTRKKDLGAIFRTYGNVYVAQVAMGADMNQLVKAVQEAQDYKGPSVVIAYCPCTSHGIKAGMANVQAEMKKAVDAGYWILYRYDPRREHPMTVDSKAPTLDYVDFLEGETRFASLRRTFPDHADTLFDQARIEAKKNYAHYKEQENQ